MRVRFVLSAAIVSIALVSAAMAGPNEKQGQQQEQSVTGTISAIAAKEQTITVTPVSAEQSQAQQAQQAQPKEGKKGVEATSYVFCLDGQTQIVGDLDKKGSLGKQKSDATAGLQKGAGSDRGVAVVAKEDKGQGAVGAQAQTGTIQSEKGKAKPVCENFDMLKIGQVVEVTYVSAQTDAAQQAGQQGKIGQDQKPAQDEKLGMRQATQATAAQTGQAAQATGGQSAQTTVAKRKFDKGIADAPATLRAVRIQLLNVVGQPVPGGAPAPPAAPPPPAVSSLSPNG